ncbi:MAG: hypothetical protein P4L51_15980 [Puia sp.]|nr:hypothetical protein [Puia sp.]
MEIILNILQSFQLDMLQVTATGLILFVIGYRIGMHKNRKLYKKIHELEKDVLDLNAELLNN